ncbi:nucleotidyltransferase family protein [Kangiella sp. TOML190]|uniref:nucleotidyltransferase family protein n=1 Tax=Kangiella sp. TOML190 TaxID=2931351 RepID=UPI00203ED961|nr:nucleotidyltransferase family protein [Kangiella sp. TOML190]
MNYERQIKQWLQSDEVRFNALKAAASLELKDWCLAAGFVRNLVWDKLHENQHGTPLNDIDLIYFDKNNDTSVDKKIEKTLKTKYLQPWSVKNQARMHLRNNDSPYSSTSDAMSYWVEIETAIGVRLHRDQTLEVIAPFGCEALFNYSITINDKRRKPKAFGARVRDKAWLENWPKLVVNY